MPRKRKYKKQSGGMLSAFLGGFGGGNSLDFLSQISGALEGFNNEPALANIFSQSNTLFEGFKNNLNEDQKGQLGDIDQFKPVFDLFSLFNQGNLGGLYQDGGEVEQKKMSKSKVQKRFAEFKKQIEEGVIDVGAQQDKARMTDAFNAKYASDDGQISQIIPGINRPQRTHKKGSKVSSKVSKLVGEGKSQKQAVAIALDMQRRNKLQYGGPIPLDLTPEQLERAQGQQAILAQYMNSPRFRARMDRITGGNQNETERLIGLRKDALGSITEESMYPGIPSRMVTPDAIAQFEPSPFFNEEEIASPINPVGMIAFLPEGINQKGILRNTTPLHEFSHAATIGNQYLTDKEVDIVNKNTVNRDAYANLYGESAEALDRFDYLTDPTEVVARVNEIRQLAVDTGLHKEFGEDFTPEQLQLLWQPSDKVPKGVDLEKGNYGAFRDLIEITSADLGKLRTLLNDLAVVEQPEDPNTRRVQKGGTIDPFMEGIINPIITRTGQLEGTESALKLSEQLPREKFTQFTKGIDLVQRAKVLNKSNIDEVLKGIGDRRNVGFDSIDTLIEQFNMDNPDNKVEFEKGTGDIIMTRPLREYLDTMLRVNMSGQIFLDDLQASDTITNEIFNFRKGILSTNPGTTPKTDIRTQNGGIIPVSSRGQFDFPGQPVMVPTQDGSITMDGVNQDILAVQGGRATVLPANSGMHQFAPGNVLEIPMKQSGGSVQGNIARGFGAIENVEAELLSMDPNVNARQISMNVPIAGLADYQDTLERVNKGQDISISELSTTLRRLGATRGEFDAFLQNLRYDPASGDIVKAKGRSQALIRNILKGTVRSKVIGGIQNRTIADTLSQRLRRDEPIFNSGFLKGGMVIPRKGVGVTIPHHNSGKVERKRKRKKSSRSVNSSKSKTRTPQSTMPQRTTRRFRERNKRQQYINQGPNAGLPFGRKVGF